jgi:methanogenic corrinoid protein MtbC1
MRAKRVQREAVAVPGCEGSPQEWPAGQAAGTALDFTLGAAKQRVARLARTIEAEVIPRLVHHHRELVVLDIAKPSAAEVTQLVAHLVDDDHSGLDGLVQALRDRGVTIEALYLELLAPAARRLGELWEDDGVDFATVTVALGRLQRLLRTLSPAFGSEVQHPVSGRRVLLTQPDDELHMFGLAMVAEFFRRDGWDVLGGVAGVGIDAENWCRRDWFDAVGFSVGHESRLPWLRDTIAAVRRVSRNTGLVVLVGGPVFTLNPAWAEEIGADATTDGRNAPALAEIMMHKRVQQQ